ncbi:MAG: TIGR03668 family PPOX class F420-dependent oxidoreductase [Acidimicrobiales bacterium]
MFDDKLLAAAARAPVARLATIAASGAVDLVPITFALSGPIIVTAIDHKPKQTRQLRRLDNITRDPRVTVLMDHYDDNEWSALWWVRMRGLATVIEDGPRFASAVAQLVAKYPQHYGRTPPQGPVIEITVTDVRTWSAS